MAGLVIADGPADAAAAVMGVGHLALFAPASAPSQPNMHAEADQRR